MPKLTVDATEATTFEAVEDDEYEVKVVSVSDVVQGPKAQYVKVEFDITDGENAGRKLWSNFPIDGAGAGMFVEFANKAIDAGLEVGEAFDFDTDDLVGAELRAVTEQEEYQGEMRSQIKRLLAQ